MSGLDIGFDPAALHFLRPAWLWALAAVPLLAGLWWMRRRRATVWREVVDPHLLPHLLDRHEPRRGMLAPWAALLACVLGVLAMAGPSWRQVEQPLWRGHEPLVVALELSSSMLAADPPPSRVAQARAKLGALLGARTDGAIGLVVYADDAYTVSPLTDDGANVAVFLDALAPDIMPLDGRRPRRAIQAAVELMTQAGFDRGRVLLVADAADAAAGDAAASARAKGFRVDVLGVGRSGGVAYRTPDGVTRSAPFDEAALRAVAERGGGHYVRIADGMADLDALGVLAPALADARVDGADGGQAWLDEGFWLLPPLMLLALSGFRRRAVAAVLALGLVLPLLPLPASAAELWRRDDQVQHRRMEAAAEAYRAGDFDRAVEGYAGVDTADGHYNRGNALAKAGHYPEAIEAYDRALALDPGMEDAAANRTAVEQAQKRQQQDGQQGGDKDEASSDADGDQGQGQSNQRGPSDDGTGPGEQAGDDASESTQRRPGDEADAPSAQDGPAPQDAQPQDAGQQADQQQADQAQRERMQQALAAQPAGDGESGEEGATARADEDPAARERRIANEAWLRRVPDDPGGLLREKFRIEYERRRREGAGEEWGR